jgi:hypothetical protein
MKQRGRQVTGKNGELLQTNLRIEYRKEKTRFSVLSRVRRVSVPFVRGETNLTGWARAACECVRTGVTGVLSARARSDSAHAYVKVSIKSIFLGRRVRAESHSVFASSFLPTPNPDRPAFSSRARTSATSPPLSKTRKIPFNERSCVDHVRPRHYSQSQLPRTS